MRITREAQAYQRPKLSLPSSGRVPFKKAAQKPGPSRRQAKDNSRRAEVNLNAESYYEVQVKYGLSEDIARGCGFNTEEVEQALMEDNLQRKFTVSPKEKQDADDLIKLTMRMVRIRKWRVQTFT